MLSARVNLPMERGCQDNVDYRKELAAHKKIGAWFEFDRLLA
jgi:hypothetical protein